MSAAPRVTSAGVGSDTALTWREQLAYVARFWALAGFAALLLITAQNVLVADLAARDWREWIYVARLACCATLVLCVPWTLLHGIERLLGRYGWLTGLLVLGAWFPFARDLGHQLASGEGVEALKVPPQTVERGATLVLALGALCVWAFQRARLRARYHVPLGLVAVLGLLAFDRVYLRTYGMLAPFVLSCALCVATATLHHALEALPRVRTPGTLAVTYVLCALLAVGFVKPGWVDAGRSSVLSDETSILILDVLAFGAEVSAVQFDLELAARTACVPPRPAPPWPALSLSDAQRRNVIMISVDALRRDVIGKRVKGRSLTPNLDRFARESRVAKHAYTSYPATLFALASATTGLLPSQVLFAPKPPDTMFRVLKERVPDVFAVLPLSEWFVQPAFPNYVTQQALRTSRRDAVAETDEMLRRLKRLRAADKRHVGWVHYLEPHAPYYPHPGFEFGSTPARTYYSEVAFVDQQIGRLLDGLREGGWFDDSLIVFFSDHGEALGERKYYGHHVFLNGWIANIPFMLHTPGAEPRPIEGAVSITDVAPTVLHFLDQAPPGELSGQSLLGRGPAPGRVIVSEAFPIRGKSLFDLANTQLTSVASLQARITLIQNADRRYQPKVSIVRDQYRLIVRRTSGTAELYDTRRDPRERRDLAAERPDVVDSMMAEMAAFHRAQASRFYCAVKALPVPRPPPLPPRPRLPIKSPRPPKSKPNQDRSQH